MQSQNGYHGISARFSSPLSVSGARPFILQYYVKCDTEPNCSGAYLKLFSSPHFDPPAMDRGDRYALMFGPDKCGDINRLHFIVDNGTAQHESASQPTSHLNAKGTLYQLMIAGPKFRISANGRIVFSGDLKEDLNLSDRPFKRPLTGVAFDLWTVDAGVGFTDLLIADSEKEVEKYNRRTYFKHGRIHDPEYVPQDNGHAGSWLDAATIALMIALALCPIAIVCCRG